MKKWYIGLNVIVPLVIGAILYYLFSPETLFVGLMDRFLGLSYHIPIQGDNILMKLVRFYLYDFLWAYALMALVLLCFGIDKKIIVLIFIFEIALELLQLVPIIRGTFDVCDIIIELIANILVINAFRRRVSDETN